MKKNRREQGAPDELLAGFLANVPEVSQNDLKELESAVLSLDQDAEFVADYLKGLVVEDVRRAMEEEGISQNALANRVGKSRQYLNKVLNQDRRVNFTIDTLAELSTALKRRLFVRMLGPTETATVFHVVSESQTVRPLDELASRPHTNLVRMNADYVRSEAYVPTKEVEHDNACMQFG